MSGLETIIQTITGDAEAEAEEILKTAKKKAEAYQNEQERLLKQEVEEADKKSGKKADLELEKRKSAALMEQRKRLLSAKQEMIAGILTKTETAVLSLPEEEYFSFLYRAADAHMQSGSGVVRLAERDLKRLPKDFETTLQAIAKKHQAVFSVSEKAADIEGGLILDYGEIEENCTVKALIHNKKEALQDMVSGFLFSSQE